MRQVVPPFTSFIRKSHSRDVIFADTPFFLDRSLNENYRGQMELNPSTYKGYNLVSAFVTGWKKAFVFSGRATRSEYWYWCLCQFIILVAVIFCYVLLFNSLNIELFIDGCMVLITLYFLVFFFPLMTVTVRRFHDIGMTGWLYLLNFVPIVGPLSIMVLCCLDSNQGCNKYGDSEKYPSEPAV